MKMKKQAFKFLILFISIFACVGIASAEDITISSNTTWQPGSYTYGIVRVTNNAVLTFNGAVTLNVSTLTVDAGSAISANAKGYPLASGPGAGKIGSIQGSGAGYGGKGGDASSGLTGGSVYGSALVPVDLGSGGGVPTSGGAGGAGGGAIRLNISGTLTLNGVITANGGNGGGYCGGGSGGSIYVTSTILTGSGTFTAHGGSGTWGGGGGGGGRIALYYQSSTFTGIAQAKGGTGYQAGEDGTVAFIDQSQNDLYVYTSFRFQQNDSPLTFNRIILNGATASCQPSTIVSANELILASSVLTLTGSETLGIDSIRVTNNSTITRYPQGQIWLIVPTLTVDAGSAISADAKGYPRASGPGAGKDGSVAGSGAGYGGKGGDASGGLLGGSIYGSALVPFDQGSGGGNVPFYGSVGGAGGGAIRLNIGGTLTLNGVITANGGNAGGYCGGGSGGSIYVTTTILTGSGALTVNGGGGTWGGGGGGGGRIALYYQSSSFSGSVQAKGGAGYRTGDDGTVAIQAPLADSFLTVFNLTEQSSHTTATTETCSVQGVTLTNVIATGDVSGSFSFSNVEIIKIISGSFTDKGFFKSDCVATLEGISYSGSCRGATYYIPSERKIYLKGDLSGDINGILQGYVTESVPGSNVYDTFKATCRLTRLGTDPTSAAITLEGAFAAQPPYTFVSDLSIYQARLEGSCYGFYTNPLSAVMTQVYLTGENAYKNEGFSIFSYNSVLGQGQAYTYNRLRTAGLYRFFGIVEGPLFGRLDALLDTSKSPKVLSGTIENVRFGTAPEPELSVRIISSSSVSPGQKVNYVIEYRNDGLVTATETAVLFCLDPFAEYVSGSAGAQYSEGINQVAWDLGNIPAKTVGYLAVQTEVILGLPSGVNLQHFAYIESFQWHSDILGRIRNGIKLPRYEYINQGQIDVQRAEYKLWRSVASKYNADWQPILNTQSDPLGVADALHAALASPIFGDGNGNPIPTIFNGLNDSALTINNSIEYSGGNAVSDGALKLGKEALATSEGNAFTKYKVSSVLFDPEVLLPLYIEKGVQKVVLYQSEYDDLLFGLNGQVYYNQITGWDVEIEGGGMVNKLNAGFLAKMFGASEVIHLWESETGKQIEWLSISMSAGDDGRYGRDRVSIKVSGQDTPIVFYLQGNPKTGELFKQEDFADVQGIQVEVRDRSEYRISHSGWQVWLLNCEDVLKNEINKKAVAQLAKLYSQPMRQAHDPNIKYGPEGDVLPGQNLQYKVEYENEGEGIAFGVYFTDTLDTDLDDTTLQIGPVVSTIDGSTIAPPGTYEPSTRTITWFVGEVGPGEGGYAELSVNVKKNASIGSEAINFATVYFPSVPEATTTNAIVNRIVSTLDGIAPVTTTSITPSPNAQGWNKEDVTVHVSAADNTEGSGVKELHYRLSGAVNREEAVQGNAVSFTLADEGITQLTYYAVDNAGNQEPEQSLEVKIDETPPVITGHASPEPNQAGWNNADVTVTFMATDGISGILSVTEPQVITEEGAGQHIGGEAMDAAGNAAMTFVTISLDKTPPEVTITSPLEGAEYVLHEPLVAAWTAHDSLSGIASAIGTVPSGGTLDTVSVGPRTFTVTAVDAADNQITRTATYSIRYGYNGVLPPINPEGTSIFKLGRTVPVKFRLQDYLGNSITTAVAQIYLAKISDQVVGSEIEPESTSAATAGNLFRYDPIENQYIFNLGTKGLSVGTWKIRIALDDGTSYYVVVSFR